jgi:hypothetical protein
LNDLSKLNYLKNIYSFARTQSSNTHQNAPKSIQGHVSKILENDFLEFTIDATGPYTLPVIKLSQAFSKYHREPTKVGDKGYAVPNDFYIGGETEDGGGTANMYPRGNLSNGIFHPISVKSFDKRDPDMFLVTGGASGHTIQSQDKTTSTIIDKLNNIIHNTISSIQHSAIKDIIHTAQGILSHNGSTINSIAKNALTHAVLEGGMNLVSQKFTVGASSGSARLLDDSTTPSPPSPPTPSSPTIFQVIGTIVADSMSAGSMSAPTQPPGSNNNAVATTEYVNSAFAFSMKTIVAPIAPSNLTALFMQGLAGTITPTAGGNILITICGTIIASGTANVDDGIRYQICYGTGTPPLNAAPLTGTQIGLAQSHTSAITPTAASDVHVPFSITYIATGLTVGTVYWIDLAAESITTASQMGLHNVMITASEI